MFRQVFRRPNPNPRPNPIFGPVRLRVCTADSLLTPLPWQLIAWNGRRLLDEDWVIETSAEPEPLADVAIPPPASCCW